MRLLLPLVLICTFLTACATSLERAAKKGDVEEITHLIDGGLDVNKGRNRNALVWAAYFGKIEAARTLIAKGVGVNGQWFASGLIGTAVGFASRSGHFDMVRLLVENGADVNVRSKTIGWTPLEGAVIEGYPRIAKYLIEHGADADSTVARFEGSPPDDFLGRRALTILRSILKKDAAATKGLPRSEREAVLPDAAGDVHSDVDTPSYSHRENPDAFAVVIGISGYKNLPDAQFAERDAQAMRDHLIAMGYPKRHIILLKGDDATRAGIQKYLEEWLPRNVKPTSNVFFYYSGHGAPDVNSGKAYLVPWDGDASFLKSTAYPVEQLYASLNKLRAKRIVVVLDACFSGAGGRSVLAKGARPLVTKVDEGFSHKGRITLFTAASGNEITTTIEDEGHGIFTYFFLKGLQGAAKNASGKLTAKGLHKYLKPKVQDEARLQNREQTPTLHTSSDLVIRSD